MNLHELKVTFGSANHLNYVPITKLPVEISSDGDDKDKKDDGRNEKLCDSSSWFPYAHEHINPHNRVEPSAPELGSALCCLMSLLRVMMEKVLVNQGGVVQGRQTAQDLQEKTGKKFSKSVTFIKESSERSNSTKP